MLYGLSYAIYPASRLIISAEDELEFVRDFTLQLQDGEMIPFLDGTPLTESWLFWVRWGGLIESENEPSHATIYSFAT